MELIALTGAKGSGKNTAYLGINEWSRGRGLRAAERGFADKLKWSVARLFRPDIKLEEAIEWANDLKDDESEIESVYVGETMDSCTGREFLQRYGTESHRDIFGEDFWVDQLLPQGHWDGRGQEPAWWQSFAEEGTGVVPEFNVITDLRFENEALRVVELGGVIWEIQRPGVESSDTHSSEQPLPREMIDKVIVNDGTVEDLLNKITTAMTSEYSEETA